MAESCNNCGYAYNAENATRCEICGAPLEHDTQSIQDNMSPESWVSETGHVQDHPDSLLTDELTLSKPHKSAFSGRPLSDRAGEATLYGRISHVERTDEKPRTDIYKVMSSILIGIMIFIPYTILFVVLGLLSFAFAFLGFSGLSQLFNPLVWTTSLFELMEVIVLRRISRKDTVTVYRGLIEDQSGREFPFFFRGPLVLGNLVEGHSVRLCGRWTGHTFDACEGNDLTTQSEITSAYRNPWKVIFVFIIILYVIMGIGIFVFYHQKVI